MRIATVPALLIGLVLLPAADPVLAEPSSELEMARLMQKEGRTEKAMEAARKALAEDPGNEGAARLLQDLLLREGEPADPEQVLPPEAPDVLRTLLAARLMPLEEAEAALRKLAGRQKHLEHLLARLLLLGAEFQNARRIRERNTGEQSHSHPGEQPPCASRYQGATQHD